MARPSKARALGIWANGLRVGRWVIPASGPMELSYEPSWVASEEARPLSLSLPLNLDGVPIKGEKVGFFFDNLLPDSPSIRQRVRAHFHTRSADPFDLLEAIGRDCVGALQLLPDDDTPVGTKKIDVTPMTDREVEALLLATTSPAGPTTTEQDELRISLAGAQEKTALTWHEGRWCKPHGATPTTHIFKLPLGLIGGRQPGSMKYETDGGPGLVDIGRRHFDATARLCGLGRDMEGIIEDVVGRTPKVIEDVEARLPKWFPARVFETISTGLRRGAEEMRRG